MSETEPKSHVENLLSEEEDWFAMFMRYGLSLAAIFQLICIGACIFLSDTDGQIKSTEIRDGKCDETSQSNFKRIHRTKKKRR